MPPPTIYYIRHGETDWNVTGRLQGRHDVPLNARGRTQACHCGNILRDRFSKIGRYPADFDYVSSRSEEHTSELQSLRHLVCRLLLEKKKKKKKKMQIKQKKKKSKNNENKNNYEKVIQKRIAK